MSRNLFFGRQECDATRLRRQLQSDIYWMKYDNEKFVLFSGNEGFLMELQCSHESAALFAKDFGLEGTHWQGVRPTVWGQPMPRSWLQNDGSIDAKDIMAAFSEANLPYTLKRGERLLRVGVGDQIYFIRGHGTDTSDGRTQSPDDMCNIIRTAGTEYAKLCAEWQRRYDAFCAQGEEKK